MKRFDNYITGHPGSPLTMVIAYVVALCVPNVVLCFTESMSWLAAITNVVLPMGVYLMILSLSVNAGKPIWWLFPAAFLGAFQIVLFFLYGGSIIGVDMFLNVLTTNSTEVGELLGNLFPALVVVFVLYLPQLVWASINLAKKRLLHTLTRRRVCKAGLICTTVGLLTLSAAYLSVPGYSIGRDLFPVNVVRNCVLSIQRVRQNANYPDTSRDFTFHAGSVHQADEPETYVVVIGETGRADHYGVNGYSRNTTPFISSTDGLVVFSRVLSESNTTHKSVPMLLSLVDARSFNDINRQKSIITAFREAGFFTAYLSTQPLNHSYIDYFGNEADYVRFANANRSGLEVKRDEALLPLLDSVLSSSTCRKRVVFLHTYGSHFSYSDRYGREFAQFQPDNTNDASAANRASLINAYDNSVVHTDYLLHRIIARLQREHLASTAMLYVCDHGEDIFDDSRRRFLHASPTPTYWQLHVPMMVWTSKQWQTSHPEQWQRLRLRSEAQVSSSRSFAPLVLDVAGVTTPLSESGGSPAAVDYTEPERVYVSDLNECLPLTRCGLKQQDYQHFTLKGITYQSAL